MPQGLYRDPLTPEQRAEFEADLIAFCDRELDKLGDIEGLNILYAGGSSLLWLEGLSQRIGRTGTLTALDINASRVEEARAMLDELDLAAPVQILAGSVFDPPFEPGAFDLVYSAGLFHELDVRERPAGDALAALAHTVRPGGRLATSDFVDSVPAVQLEDEEVQRELARAITGTELYGVGSPRRLLTLHKSLLDGVRENISSPYPVRHLDKVVLAEEEPEVVSLLPAELRRRLLGRWEALRERVRREGYTRLATVYVEGLVARSSLRRP